jgi:glycosyltransferase involved in cell wall biosynthesis
MEPKLCIFCNLWSANTNVMKVLHLLSRISRLAGGLFETVPGLTQAVGQLPGMDVSVLGVEDEFYPQDKTRWPCKVAAVPLGGGAPRKLLYAPGMLRQALQTDASLMLCHGLWTHHNYVAVQWAKRTGRPYLVSPHGMLDEVDLRKSRLVKWTARKLYVDRLFRGAACIRAISESEVGSARAFGIRGPICLIPNGICLPEPSKGDRPPWMERVPRGKKILFYLGRLNPKKGLPTLLTAWAQLQRQSLAVADDWHLVIAGWDQYGHESELKSQAEALGVVKTTLFPGPLFGSAKHAAYRYADAFVIPSTSEGMPTAVLEAWAYGVPVLMTPQCNLPDGFARQAALRIETDVDSIEHGLGELLAMSESARRSMAERGRGLVEAKFSWREIANQMHDVYEWILGRRPCPGSVRLN